MKSIANEVSVYTEGMGRDYLNDRDSQATQQKKKKEGKQDLWTTQKSFSEKLNDESINKCGNRNCAMQLEGII